MLTYDANTPHVSVQVRYPSAWHFTTKCVPDLVVPRELFGLSNRPIRLTPKGSSQPRPMIDGLDPGAMFLWCYYQAPGDPDPATIDPVPDYRRHRLPLRYEDSQVFRATDAREWKASDFSWRRHGFVAGDVPVTIWTWEGTRADSAAISAAEAIIATVSAT